MSITWEREGNVISMKMPITQKELQAKMQADMEKTSKFWRTLIWWFMGCVMLVSAYKFYLMVR